AKTVLITTLNKFYTEICPVNMLENKILNLGPDELPEVALEVFRFQYEHNFVYKRYCDYLRVTPSDVNTYLQIPFLPVSLFKNNEVKTTDITAEVVFESSDTTGMISSPHHVKKTK